ncbi:hypothetical protein LOTGIDRAFT_173282 [Lottia gigantea]|uniref:Uncharacterized protein n=1 Tax=Lottia gigantea TaxID=225164 RepID=V4ASR4_LOTGI|nr:hypothetical protein LOTGIDRAFT_173282 [Lottia gigantea]ESP00318.1 hypothetical protein LOTGIDRAFT_173282 [Lottia gigantea]
MRYSCLLNLNVLSNTEGNKCPDEIENVVQTCIEESGMYNLKHTIGSVFIDGRLDTQFCRSGMDIAVTCIENILNFCQDDLEQKRMLNLLVDIDKLRTSFYYFCQNIHVFATNQSCLIGLYQVPVCIDRVTHEQNLQTNSTQPPDVTVMGLMNSLCG